MVNIETKLKKKVPPYKLKSSHTSDLILEAISDKVRNTPVGEVSVEEFANALSKTRQAEESWLKKNLVALIGSTLTFLAAVASIIVSAIL